jgi:hypothetical protein
MEGPHFGTPADSNCMKKIAGGVWKETAGAGRMPALPVVNLQEEDHG